MIFHDSFFRGEGGGEWGLSASLHTKKEEMLRCSETRRCFVSIAIDKRGGEIETKEQKKEKILLMLKAQSAILTFTAAQTAV